MKIGIVGDAPDPVPTIEQRLVPFVNADDLALAQASRRRPTAAVAAIHPVLLIDGYFHVAIDDSWTHPDTGHHTRVFGLGKEYDRDGGLALLDTATLDITHINANLAEQR